MRYSDTELRILWYLKRNGPIERGTASLIQEFADILGIKVHSLTYCLRNLENQSIILRTYERGKPEFADNRGPSALIRVELVDPNMQLPAIEPLPLAIVVARENEELYERTVHEPSPDDVIMALLTENTKLRDQIEKLKDIIEGQAKELIKHQEQSKRKVPEHLMSQVKDALPPEIWEEITHGRK